MKTPGQFILGGFVCVFTLVAVATVLVFFWGVREFQKPGPLTETKIIEIERGNGLYGIAHRLQEEGAIDNAYVFIFGARFLGAQGKLKAGEYEIGPGLSDADILEKIRKGDTYARRVTIPEGLTSFEVESLVAKVKDLTVVRSEIPAEGTLLPGTYDYRRGESNSDLLQEMETKMTAAVGKLWEERGPNLPFSSKEEAVILASIVEKETSAGDERKRVAGVFINRLRKGMALQTDPTVIYALTGGRPKNEGQGPLGRRLLAKDLAFESPYNTYLHPGLPPGPIANPGMASLEAVLHPEEHNFLYFVANGSGGHVFSATLEEHNRNVAQWQKIRQAQEKKE